MKSTVDGAKLRAARRRARLTQADLAVLIGVSKQSVSLLELGRRRPRPGTLARLAAVLDIAVKDSSRGR
jgi:transcriptional regulator with XRE-family HTH domain